MQTFLILGYRYIY